MLHIEFHVYFISCNSPLSEYPVLLSGGRGGREWMKEGEEDMKSGNNEIKALYGTFSSISRNG